MSIKAPRNPMPSQDAIERKTNFKEVALGYDKETAINEAKRCLQCKKPMCMQGCPVEVDIPDFIGAIAEENFEQAAKIIKNKNNLPAVCGRVCPQESQCEQKCILGIKGEPVAIGRLERFIADWEAAEEGKETIQTSCNNKKVAVIGAGPSGLTCAGDLAKLGYDVTVFEALHTPGGVLMYGIPEFRLPKTVVKREIDYIRDLGVKIETNSVMGKIGTVDELMNEEGFSAVYIATGAGLPHFMNIPGENLNGVYSANEFLTRTNLMAAYNFPNFDTPIKVGEKVAVIGAGNVAMDSARTALRLGAKESIIVYRRSKNEIPARLEELEHAEEEGVQLFLLTSPISINGDENGQVKSMTCLKYELGEPDSSGRCRPIAIEGSEFEMEIDTVIMAIGQGPNPLVANSTPGLDLTKRGNIIADEETGLTSKDGVFAGGDIVTGAATVILAMGAGKKAARAIHDYLENK
ncbi:sulfide dehydrogenase (flavoprotein) subunit SudA [Desulfonispora thiosulfatigenes DSM 11270]|uniref:Sulfide dehydrogenase (Flavoprotein) subunit SudA n=1 Tax=Desulfonispora thiosulfatigenes DSM 11270 TaxID=656914 RepID=A0A1W1VPP8_DESTI|nr:NADPH-dependent glutamate synthase [Desulfonispora thiosulfatigenes]SMB94884.1 sulfide dehydrogenase (flavoprotein) subunit SudA [Desulfonispora thiosulfatigenes DSM 11270]